MISGIGSGTFLSDNMTSTRESKVDRLTSASEKMLVKSADEIVEELTQSVQKSAAGHTKSARSVSAKMKEKYAV